MMKQRMAALLAAFTVLFAAASPTAFAARKKTSKTTTTAATTESALEETTTAPAETKPTDTASEEVAVSYQHIVDVKDIIAAENKARIESAAHAVYKRNGVELFCYVTDETLKKPATTAKQVYTERARTDAGVLLLYEEKKVRIYTYGRADNLFSTEEATDILTQANEEESYTDSFLTFISLTGKALDEKGTAVIPDERLLPRLVDDADLLSESEESTLLEQLDTVSEARQLDVVVVTKQSLDGKTSTEYADDFYDYNGYGFGEERDGILLLIGMEDRDWAITTTGKGIPIFTDAGQEYMTDKFVPYMSDGDFAKAFMTYADLCDQFIEQYDTNGAAYDVGNLPKSPFNVPLALFGSVGGGLVVGLIAATVMKSELKSVRAQAAAGAYTKPGSLHITDRNDLYLYNTVTRTRKPEPSSSSSGGGGGSSHHSSSSGSSHGGSSGHF